MSVWHIVRTSDTYYALTVRGTRADAEKVAANYRPNGRDLAPAHIVPCAPDYAAAADARRCYGDDYADAIQRHTAELLAKHDTDVRGDSLGARLVGNDGN